MGIRKIQLRNGRIYHICTKSIEKFKVFKNHYDFRRMKEIIVFYEKERAVNYSHFLELNPDLKNKILNENSIQYVDIIAYCIMPTHIHLLLFQRRDGGISKYMEKVLKSYSIYFNRKYKRKGPLWAGRFSNVMVEDDEQLIHLTRYIHLNPVSAFLVEKPEEWEFSSYREYIGSVKNRICNWEGFIDISPEKYKEFVEERKDYQRELQKIKLLTLE